MNNRDNNIRHRPFTPDPEAGGSAWVLLDEHGRLSPLPMVHNSTNNVPNNQQFAFFQPHSTQYSDVDLETNPGDVSDSSYSSSFRITPALSLFDSANANLNVNRQVEQVLSFRSDPGSRMQEAEKNLNLDVISSKAGGSSSNSIGSYDEHDAEVTRILNTNIENPTTVQLNMMENDCNKNNLKYGGRSPPVPVKHRNVDELPAEDKDKLDNSALEFLEVLKQKKKERREKLKQKKINQINKSLQARKINVDEGESSGLFARIAGLVKRYAMPLAVSHFVALLVGIYLGKTASSANVQLKK